jgi:hypothetical protein
MVTENDFKVCLEDVYGAVLCTTVQHGVVRYGAVHYSADAMEHFVAAVQCSTSRHGMIAHRQ